MAKRPIGPTANRTLDSSSTGEHAAGPLPMSGIREYYTALEMHVIIVPVLWEPAPPRPILLAELFEFYGYGKKCRDTLPSTDMIRSGPLQVFVEVAKLVRHTVIPSYYTVAPRVMFT